RILSLVTVTDQDAKALAHGSRSHFPSQPCLAHALAARQQHDGALTVASAVDQATQQRGFLLPSNKRCVIDRCSPDAAPRVRGRTGGRRDCSAAARAHLKGAQSEVLPLCCEVPGNRLAWIRRVATIRPRFNTTRQEMSQDRLILRDFVHGAFNRP